MNSAQAVAERDEHQVANVEPHPASDSAALIAAISRAASDPDVDIDKMERLMQMHERMTDRAREDEARAARKSYFGAMAKCQAELPVVTRNQTNSHTNSQYADLAAIEQQAMPVIHRHGFGTMFQPAGYNEKGELQIKWKITHGDGHSESDIAGVPVDGAGSQGKVNKTGTQAFGSTATYARRYLLCMLFNISTGDDKDGNKVSETVTEEQVEEINALIDEAVDTRPDTDRAAWLTEFLKFMNVGGLLEIRTKDFKKATDAIRGAIKQGKK